MAEYMDLNEDSKAEQLKHAEALRRYEAQKRARSIVVPTAIPDVKARLRELGEPITLFGEGPADRRERLREEIAKLELDQEQLNKLQDILSNKSAPQQQQAVAGAKVTIVQHTGKAGVKETFYSPASEELIAARQDILEYSIPRTEQRLQRSRDIRSSEELRKELDDFVYDLYENSMELTLNASQIVDERPLTAVKYSPDGQMIATGALSAIVKIWSVDMLQSMGTLRNTTERITELAWHPQSRSGNMNTMEVDDAPSSSNDVPSLLAAASADGNCYIWDIRRCLRPSSHGQDGNQSMEVEGSNLESTPNYLMHSLSGHAGPVATCDFHSCGRYIATGGHDFTWRLWDVEMGKQLLLQDGHTSDCSSVCFHPDGSLLVSADSSGVVHVWDLRSGQSIYAVAAHVKKITSVSCSSNGYQFATSSVDNAAKIWDLRRKKCHYTLPAHANIISDVKYSASGEMILTSSFDGTLKVWGSRDFRILRTLAGHTGKVMAADFAPDEKHLISGGYDRTLKLWAHVNEF